MIINSKFKEKLGKDAIISSLWLILKFCTGQWKCCIEMGRDDMVCWSRSKNWRQRSGEL